jgi:hypothetical protein
MAFLLDCASKVLEQKLKMAFYHTPLRYRNAKEKLPVAQPLFQVIQKLVQTQTIEYFYGQEFTQCISSLPPGYIQDGP